jgi:hypothetical protein
VCDAEQGELHRRARRLDEIDIAQIEPKELQVEFEEGSAPAKQRNDVIVDHADPLAVRQGGPIATA